VGVKSSKARAVDSTAIPAAEVRAITKREMATRDLDERTGSTDGV
jgi:hypothetical protein